MDKSHKEKYCPLPQCVSFAAIITANHYDQDDESRRSGGPCERTVTSASASAIGPSGKSPDGDRGGGEGGRGHAVNKKKEGKKKRDREGE